MKALEWITVQRKVNDLLPLSINPRKISDSRLEELRQSIEKFNLADIPVINFDNTIISGHQRMKVMQLLGRGDEMIDVRFPNRKLSDAELRQYNVISNTHAGEWDFEAIEVDFPELKESEWSFLNEIHAPIVDSNNDSPEEKNTFKNEDQKDLSDRIYSKFVVEATCIDESAQEELYELLTQKGYECRLLTL